MKAPLTQAEFDSAHQEWNDQTHFHSFPHTILNGSGFQRIKALGPQALPFLLQKLQLCLQDPQADVCVWGTLFYLPQLTGEDVFIGEEETIQGTKWRKGDVYATVEAWVKWGERKGLLLPKPIQTNPGKKD